MKKVISLTLSVRFREECTRLVINYVFLDNDNGLHLAEKALRLLRIVTINDLINS